LKFSLSGVQICLRAYLRANRHKNCLIEQQKAAGTYTEAFQNAYDMVFPNDSTPVPPFDPLQLDIFCSPWAVDRKDEVFFTHTVDHLGQLVGEDVKLGSLFMILVLTTPGQTLSHQTKDDLSLRKIQFDILLLIYRYLKNKLGDTDQARQITDSLILTTMNVHQCRDIHLNKRICLSSQEAFN